MFYLAGPTTVGVWFGFPGARSNKKQLWGRADGAKSQVPVPGKMHFIIRI